MGLIEFRFSRRRHERGLLALLTTLLTSLAFLCTSHASLRAAEQATAMPRLEVRRGDHVSIIGNTLADRMQHDGWLETSLHIRFPRHQLVIRNLGFSGDEVAFRQRSAGFGSPDEHLARNKTDIVFAFFGYNESLAGPAGLDKFRSELDQFIKHTLSQKYNGKSAPRIVLFSPIAHEDLHDRNLPDGSLNNLHLERYTAAMADVARMNQVFFVDLFTPTVELYRKPSRPITINGIHLTSAGNRWLAAVIDRALFGDEPAPTVGPDAHEKLRRAVLDKNFYWFNRYRTVDGYSIYGGRADLKFVGGQTNREVMQREMEVLDGMTSNRDRRIWAVAQGGDLKVDDGNTPPFIPVKTNKPGAGPHGEHVFLDGEEAIRKMKVAKGLKINLFASEKEFPELAKPVQMAFDPQGRLWVAVWPTYPHWKPKEEMNDKILILEDTDGDGKADKCTVFADHLHCPTGFEFYNGGVLVAQAPDLLFLKDTHGTGKADVRVRVLSGLDSADTHHTANSFALDPGGALYFQEGTFHRTQVETAYGPPERCADAGVFRYEPRTQKFEVYVSHPFANPHGHVWDRWGQDIVYDGTGANPYHGALFSGHVDFPNKHAHPPQVYQQRTRPCPGVEILSSRHFPPENQGNVLVGNVIGFQGILQYKIRDNNSSFAGSEVEPIVSSSDPNFRPSDLKIGPDGALYFLDWQNPIIGHMQHNLRDPSRDRTHGRIYRVTCEGRPLLQPVKIAGEPIEKLLELLKSPEDRVRYRVKIELGGRDSSQVIAATDRWVAKLDKNDSEYAHHLLEALWVHQYHNAVNVDILTNVLASSDFRARAAAARVLCYWRDGVPDSLERFKKLAGDEHPRVRLETVRAASFYTVPDAVEVVMKSEERPSDPYLAFVKNETMKTLAPHVMKAIATGQRIPFKDPATARLFLKSLSTDDLLKMRRDRGVCLQLLSRRGIRDELRREALASVARQDHESEAAVLLGAIKNLDRENASGGAEFDLVRLLTDQSAGQLGSVRAQLQQLATGGERATTRQLAFVALIAADSNTDKAWELGAASRRALEDLLHAVPIIRDPSLRASLYPRVEAVLRDYPSPLPSPQRGEGVKGKPSPRGGEGGASSPLAPPGRGDGGEGSTRGRFAPSPQPSPLGGEGAEVRRAAMNALTYMRGREPETVKILSPFVQSASDRDAAIRALQRIPSSYWPPESAGPLLESLLAYLRKLPARERTSPAALDALQLGHVLASLLPPGDARRVRKELGELGVPVIRIGTVTDQMLYDKEKIAVRAGRPAEILFENNDLMPHNFVVTQPGALEEVGLLGEATATQPGALERNYVPGSDKIILASRLLQPQHAQKLSFTAPTRPGVYPYVCTYPGHWRRMYGAMYVVDDLDEYSADAEAYLVRHPLPAADELLKFIRPRKEWKFEELAPAVGQLGQGRSYGNGKQMFQVANCVACHRFAGMGNEFGPDLAKLDPKLTPADVLRDILEPSAKINEKYCTYVFETGSGKIVTGIVLEETADVVKVIENPLLKAEPVVLRRSDILERKKSPTSMMPKGLLDKLTREEIMDLIAYITSHGEPRHPLFQAAHDHAHQGQGPRR
jgi:putative heme-binding domain-containing protein